MAIHRPMGSESQHIDGQTIKKIILEVVAEHGQGNNPNFQSVPILKDVLKKIGLCLSAEGEQTILTVWHDLFRTGFLAWGYDVDNPDPPFCHVTNLGRETLKHLSRDPANPDGYLAYLDSYAKLDEVSHSYLDESLICYNSACYKAAAVMIGATAESLILRLRDVVVNHLNNTQGSPHSNLIDWRIKTVRDELTNFFEEQRTSMSKTLRESFNAYWSPFAEQIRRSRNDAGHPASLSPVTPESVHASLLIFPELARLITELETWLNSR